MDQDKQDAIDMLKHVLQSQPGMFTGVSLTNPRGAEIADFCADFIQKYSERLSRSRDQSQR